MNPGAMVTLLVEHREAFLAGFAGTVLSSLIALGLALAMGTILAAMRVSRIGPLEKVSTGIIEFLQNTPLLVQVFLFYAGLPVIGVQLSGFMSGSLGLAVYTSAFIAEALRAGIQSVPRGQMEAATSSGLSYIQAMRFVILPQAFRIVIPPLGNQSLNLIKNSSILGIVAGGDLMYRGDLISAETFLVTETYLVVALFYLILTLPVSRIVNRLEQAGGESR